MPESLTRLASEIGACRICVDKPRGKPLPHTPRPVCVLSASARIAICGQAPGTRVHASGLPFDDPSGDRLRAWLGVDRAAFYDPSRFAIVPMGFCFPGLDAKGGDLPPRPECRQAWHDRVFAAMPRLGVKLLLGRHARDFHLPERVGEPLYASVAAWQEIAERPGDTIHLVLPHPSWRNNSWLNRNPWFARDVLPFLRSIVEKHALN